MHFKYYLNTILFIFDSFFLIFYKFQGIIPFYDKEGLKLKKSKE